MTDNFDLKKFLKENKSLENLNPIIKKNNLSEGNLRSKIKEMIAFELSGDENPEEDYSDYFYDIDTPEEDLEEAKKKKDKEEVEDVETTDTETADTIEDLPAEDAPEGGGLEDIAANMEGTESELMGYLMDALKISKGMNNEKLTTQIGNTLKFFVGEYIGGGNE